MGKQDEISIERLDQTNINSLPVLYHAVYGREIAAAFFQTKYETGYSALVYAGYIAYTKERRPVAFLGAIPCELTYNKKIISAVQLTDGMTDPAFRSNGLFVQLIEAITELCRQYNVHFLFGFPNQYALPVFLNRPGWKRYGKMDFFCIPAQAIPLEIISRKFSVLQYFYNRYQERVLKKYETLPATKISSHASGVYISDRYAEYKYPGSTTISILQALIRARISNGIIIGEICVQENEFDEVMVRLKKLAHKLGVNKLVFHCSTGSELHRLFAERYKAMPSFTIVSKDLGAGIPLDAVKFTYGDIDIF
jgi:GNAT superfamily N-acetyltransferase